MKIDTAMAVAVGMWSLVAVIVLVGGTGLLMALRVRRQHRRYSTSDAEVDARRWYDMLGGQLKTLSAGEDQVASQALSDAAEQYSKAADQLAHAKTISEFRAVRSSATDGLRFIGAARARLGMVAGPQGPPPVAPDGRPMYEAGYRAAPMAMDGHNEHYEPRGSSASVIARGVVRLMRHH